MEEQLYHLQNQFGEKELLKPIYDIMNQSDIPLGQRKEFVKEWLDQHDTATGGQFRNYYLRLLADVMLLDELKDRNPHKVSHNEYPILSRWQQEYRQRREFSLKLAEERAADGNWYKRNRPKR